MRAVGARTLGTINRDNGALGLRVIGGVLGVLVLLVSLSFKIVKVTLNTVVIDLLSA